MDKMMSKDNEINHGKEQTVVKREDFEKEANDKQGGKYLFQYSGSDQLNNLGNSNDKYNVFTNNITRQ